ncbi:hypothetical protein GCM10010336_04450 [Streptomyces goshikiensis]|nr:hypothetical protein GCM10010336_04450 [Streptomyces goshikiensis]
MQAAGVGDGAQGAQVPDLKLHVQRVGRGQWTAPATDDPPNPAILREVGLPKPSDNPELSVADIIPRPLPLPQNPVPNHPPPAPDE